MLLHYVLEFFFLKMNLLSYYLNGFKKGQLYHKTERKGTRNAQLTLLQFRIELEPIGKIIGGVCPGIGACDKLYFMKSD